MLHPRDADDLCQIIADAASTGKRLEIVGGGTRRDFGAPRNAVPVSMQALSGVVAYDPGELVLTVRPGTSLAEISALLESKGQMLAFEPWGDADSTIGGTVAAGVAGSRRVTAGGARDHLLGFAAVSGRGEPFVAGGKVVKNVTGFDLPKLMAGSWGRLGAITELTLKVLPSPRVTATMIVSGVPLGSAHSVMARALGSNADVSAAAYLADGRVLLRIAGFAPSVDARCARLPGLLAWPGEPVRVDEGFAAPLWRQAMTGHDLAGEVCWLVHVPARHCAELVMALEQLEAQWAMDWGGGRLWIATNDQSQEVRDAAARLRGSARLVRAPAGMRERVSAFHPRAQGVAALEHRVRAAFDPAGVFLTGRFREDGHADQIFA